MSEHSEAQAVAQTDATADLPTDALTAETPVSASVESDAPVIADGSAEPQPTTAPVAVESALTEVVAAAAPISSQPAQTTDADKRPVRVLSVGMEVDGVVKRITEFGAFVDIGVGRDGLVHISELSVRRVAKVTDVLQVGQSITAWIKQLDRERNRIGLTLISPGTATIRDLNKDDVVNGTVTRIVPYGAFVDVGVGRDALLHIREMAEGYVKRPEDVVQVGEQLEARVIEVSKRRGRIDLSIKGLRPEPESAQAAPAATSGEPTPQEEEVRDHFADVEVLSPIELAFQKAMTGDSDDLKGIRQKGGKRKRRDDVRSIQDEIIARTLQARP